MGKLDGKDGAVFIHIVDPSNFDTLFKKHTSAVSHRSSYARCKQACLALLRQNCDQALNGCRCSIRILPKNNETLECNRYFNGGSDI